MDTGGVAWMLFAGQVELVKLMLGRGWTLDRERHGEALRQAAARGHEPLVQLLIEKEVNTDVNPAAPSGG